MHICEDDLTGAEIISLLREHFEEMHAITPVGSAHALDVQRLKSPDITFWSVWESGELLGCGALKALGDAQGEVKSMRVAKGHLRKGIASHLLTHIVDVAKARGYRQLLLETGSFPAFAPARALYEKHGFDYTAPFGDYVLDPNSVFMVKEI